MGNLFIRSSVFWTLGGGDADSSTWWTGRVTVLRRGVGCLLETYWITLLSMITIVRQVNLGTPGGVLRGRGTVTVHGSVCSFCVRLCGWTRSLCLSALPSNRAPDEVIRTVTGVARLHFLYLAGVSVVRCQIVIALVVSYSLCQSSRSRGCSRLVAVQYSLKGADWTVFFARAGDSALPGLLHLDCRVICTSTVFWSCQIKTVYFHSQLDLELLYRDSNTLLRKSTSS